MEAPRAKERYLTTDVAILGSGFAGSLCALILQRMGLRPVVVDRARHPRFAIGESSTPVADMILRDLADRYGLPRLKPLSAYGPWQGAYPHLVAGRKRGFSYFHHTPEHPFQADPRHASELLVAASSDDYHCDTHWLRADVDGFLAEEVRAAGIPLLEDTEIVDLRRDSGWHMVGRSGAGRVEIEARFVIDGSGYGRVVPRFLGIGDTARTFHTHSRALYAHFTNVARWGDLEAVRAGRTADHPFPCDDAALHHVLDDAWMWVLRFNNGLVSAGLVFDVHTHPLDAALPPEQEWAHGLVRYPSVHEQFAAARLADPPGRVFRTARLQRHAARAAGTDWALLPHTAGFVDPLHSTGIAHSLCGVERLMHILSRHWGRPTLAEGLRAYAQGIDLELTLIDGLVSVCYRSMRDFRLFTASTMLYFAATIRYERERLTHDGAAPERLFLGADDGHLRGLVADARARLAGMDARTASEAEIAGYERFIEDGIRPYNTAGLFRPGVPNMYHHTAPPR